MLEFDDPKRLWYYICDEVKIMRFFLGYVMVAEECVCI